MLDVFERKGKKRTLGGNNESTKETKSVLVNTVGLINERWAENICTEGRMESSTTAYVVVLLAGM